MRGSSFFSPVRLLASLFTLSALAQDQWTDPTTGIEFYRQVVSSSQTAGGFEWGYALPGTPTGSNDEYIGYIVCCLYAQFAQVCADV